MARISKLLDDEVRLNAKRELKKISKYTYVAKKLDAVLASCDHGITEVAKIYKISRTTLTDWIKFVKDKSIDKLYAPLDRKKKAKLNDENKILIKKWVEDNPNITIQELQMKIEKELDITLSYSTAHRALRSLNFAYITPRPKHYKQDKNLAEDFKKKSTE